MKNNDLQLLLKPFNDVLAKYNYEMRFTVEDDCFYCLDIYRDGKLEENYASGYYKNELGELINEAYAHLMCKAKFEKRGFSYRVVEGWTHDIPALIASITDVPLFFHDNKTGEIENVDFAEGGIDSFERRDGDFCVYSYDYDLALRQIREHDEFGVER